MTTMVKNLNGALVDFDAAVELMDDGTRQNIADNYFPVGLQRFFSLYESIHKTKYGEEWALSKVNPIY